MYIKQLIFLHTIHTTSDMVSFCLCCMSFDQFHPHNFIVKSFKVSFKLLGNKIMRNLYDFLGFKKYIFNTCIHLYFCAKLITHQILHFSLWENQKRKVYVSKALFANKLDLLSLVDRVTASQFLSISHLIHHYRIFNWGFSSN